MALKSKTNLLSTARGKPWASIALLGILIILLPLLAFLQYRWIGQVVTAERQRLQQSLDGAGRRLREDIQNELERVSFTFRLGEWSEVERFESQMSRFHDQWKATAPYPELIERIYVVPVTSEGEVAPLALEPETGELVEAELPERITEWLRFDFGGGARSRENTTPPKRTVNSGWLYPSSAPMFGDGADGVALDALGACAVGRFSARRITRDGDRSVSVTGEWAFWTPRRRWVRHGCLNRPSFGLICGRYPCHQAA